jgi:hypothetical protein
LSVVIGQTMIAHTAQGFKHDHGRQVQDAKRQNQSFHLQSSLGRGQRRS